MWNTKTNTMKGEKRIIENEKASIYSWPHSANAEKRSNGTQSHLPKIFHRTETYSLSLALRYKIGRTKKNGAKQKETEQIEIEEKQRTGKKVKWLIHFFVLILFRCAFCQSLWFGFRLKMHEHILRTWTMGKAVDQKSKNHLNRSTFTHFKWLHLLGCVHTSWKHFHFRIR